MANKKSKWKSKKPGGFWLVVQSSPRPDPVKMPRSPRRDRDPQKVVSRPRPTSRIPLWKDLYEGPRYAVTSKMNIFPANAKVGLVYCLIWVLTKQTEQFCWALSALSSGTERVSTRPCLPSGCCCSSSNVFHKSYYEWSGKKKMQKLSESRSEMKAANGERTRLLLGQTDE